MTSPASTNDAIVKTWTEIIIYCGLTIIISVCNRLLFVVVSSLAALLVLAPAVAMLRWAGCSSYVQRYWVDMMVVGAVVVAFFSPTRVMSVSRAKKGFRFK